MKKMMQLPGPSKTISVNGMKIPVFVPADCGFGGDKVASPNVSKEFCFSDLIGASTNKMPESFFRKSDTAFQFLFDHCLDRPPRLS